MFKKVLIANRGACASRIIKTLKEMHITAVAVYAQADRQSLHVQNADEAYCLGDGGAKDTYLDIDKIICIAKEAGVQAIHPGYGFLSENADFVKQVEAEDLAFIGPTCEQILIFGLKHKAREVAIAAGVPLSPGSGLLVDVQQAKCEAKRIGYPLMLKSTAGGGGIGMKLCWEEQDLVSGFQSIKKLSANNFSNDGIYLEKYIEHARHIEVQMIGDGKGNALALGERDCSSQRRNQKVKAFCSLPVLRKDFIIDTYQIFESKLAHADAILLLANTLSATQLQEFEEQANDLGLDVLIEIHHQEDIKKIEKCRSPIIGINNRNLHYFTTDINHCIQLKKELPQDKFIVCESGVRSPQDICLVTENGIYIFLIGKYLMQQKNSEEGLRKLIETNNDNSH